MAPEAFGTQLDFLKQNNYTIISATQLIDNLSLLNLSDSDDASLSSEKNERTRIEKGVVLTFDDGCENVYTEAFSRLNQHGFTATVFVVTDWIGEKGRLSWQQIRRLHSAGITIASHSCSHPHLPDLDFATMKIEIERSKDILEQGLGAGISLFCYPFGGFSREVVETVHNSGYRIAFTTNRSLDGISQDRFTIRRIRMNSTTNQVHLWAKCSGYYDLFRKPRQAY